MINTAGPLSRCRGHRPRDGCSGDGEIAAKLRLWGAPPCSRAPSKCQGFPPFTEPLPAAAFATEERFRGLTDGVVAPSDVRVL